MSSSTLSARRGEWLRERDADLPIDSEQPAGGRTIGVLALQGAFFEHARSLRRLGATVIEVRNPGQLAQVEALVMPGGESTTMSKLLVTSGLFEPLAKRLTEGFPVFGTCAGMILLATNVVDGRADQKNFAAVDITVRRNGYGRQIDSFEADLDITGLDAPFRAIFIRAPLVESVGADVDVLASADGHPVLCRAGKNGERMVASFHPELTSDLRLHKLFVQHAFSSGGN